MIKGLSSLGRTAAFVGVLALAGKGAGIACAQGSGAAPNVGAGGATASGARAPGLRAPGAEIGGVVTPGVAGAMAPLPDVTPGVASAGASRVPVTGSTPNAATADYPTDATADYVFACMASNGNSRTSLEQCSCSFNVVATLLPYERYVEASTFLSMGQVAGEKGSLFRSSEQAKNTVGDLRRAQAEAEVRCFK